MSWEISLFYKNGYISDQIKRILIKFREAYHGAKDEHVKDTALLVYQEFILLTAAKRFMEKY